MPHMWKGSIISYFNFFPKCVENFEILIQESDFHLSKIDQIRILALKCSQLRGIFHSLIFLT